MFQGVDPAGWYAMLQAQWQMFEAYKLAGQVQLEAQQREHAMLLQHQFETMCAELKVKGDTHTRSKWIMSNSLQTFVGELSLPMLHKKMKYVVNGPRRRNTF